MLSTLIALIYDPFAAYRLIHRALTETDEDRKAQNRHTIQHTLFIPKDATGKLTIQDALPHAVLFYTDNEDIKNYCEI